MGEYIKHIMNQVDSNINGKIVSYCGIDITNEWAFQGVDHAVSSNKEGSRFLPCKKCVNKIIKILN